MRLVNLSPDRFNPRFVNPEQVDAVIADDDETIVYAGQYFYKVRKHYTKVIAMLTGEECERGEPE